MITIARRLSTARDARSMIVVDEGAVVELGTHQEFFERVGASAELWRSWHPE